MKLKHAGAVWGTLVLLLSAACGENDALGDPPVCSSCGAGGSFSGGAEGGDGGDRGDSGGGPFAAGAGGSGAAAAGAGGEAGESGGTGAGAAGRGGASGEGGTTAGGGGGIGACEGEYLACGCGCCDEGPEEVTHCVYPELDESIEDVVLSDQAVAMGNCANVGCSFGARYGCCVSVPPEVDASYSVSLYIGAIDRLFISLESARGCARISLAHLFGSPSDAPLELPENWDLESATYGPCGDETAHAIGALGEIAVRSVGQTCVTDGELTLFFPREAGGVEAVGLLFERLSIEGSSTFYCP